MSADGKWNISVAAPTGPQQRQLTITTSNNTFIGIVEGGPQGQQQVSGKVAGDKLSWTAEVTQPMPMTLQFDVTVTGDKMSGTVGLGPMGSVPLTGTRAA